MLAINTFSVSCTSGTVMHSTPFQLTNTVLPEKHFKQQFEQCFCGHWTIWHRNRSYYLIKYFRGYPPIITRCPLGSHLLWNKSTICSTCCIFVCVHTIVLTTLQCGVNDTISYFFILFSLIRPHYGFRTFAHCPFLSFCCSSSGKLCWCPVQTPSRPKTNSLCCPNWCQSHYGYHKMCF